MANKCICFVTDNSALVDIINRQTSKHKLIMLLVRDLVFTSLNYNILFRARHIAGVHNSLADLLSRFQVSQFKQIFPEADEMPTRVPDLLLPKTWLLPWTISFLQRSLRGHESCILELGPFSENFTNALLLPTLLVCLSQRPQFFVSGNWLLPLYHLTSQQLVMCTKWRTYVTPLKHFWSRNYWQRKVTRL